MNATLASPNYTTTVKAFIKQTFTNLVTNFQSRNILGREDYFSKKSSESFELSWSYFKDFGRIPLDPVDEITYYHLLLRSPQQAFLKAKLMQYVTSPTTPTPVISCPTTAPPTTPSCPPPGYPAIYMEKDVVVVDDIFLGSIPPVGNCSNSQDGTVFYYAGNTTSNWSDVYDASGRWDRRDHYCPSPCLCNDTVCYTPKAHEVS
uniref:Uncharacterized protein n=1 Tax=Panagrolaimus sp. ES5 TaxID=591445 RepID=A0AC34FH51_9BILA